MPLLCDIPVWQGRSTKRSIRKRFRWLKKSCIGWRTRCAVKGAKADHLQTRKGKTTLGRAPRHPLRGRGVISILQRRDSVACVSGVMECRTSWRLRPSAPGTDTTTPVNVGARGTTSLWGRCFRAAAGGDSCECRRWGLNPHRCCHPRDFESRASANSATPAWNRVQAPKSNCTVTSEEALCVRRARHDAAPWDGQVFPTGLCLF